MKNNLKTKVMLAVLAGGMLCANGAWAYEVEWYGTTGNQWTTAYADAVASNLTLTLGVNTVDINGNGYSNVTRFTGGFNAGTTNVINNILTFDPGNDKTIAAADYIIGGAAGYGNTSENVVNIKSGNYTSDVKICGGRVGEGSGKVLGNQVIIDGGIFNGSKIYGGEHNESGEVEDNIVTINGGTFNGSIYGGYSKNGNAAGNSVIINGGKYTGTNIYGGYVLGDEVGEAKNNSVTINGGEFTTACIFVGYSDNSSSNNILNINTKVKGSFEVVNFVQKMNFTLPSNITNGETMLSTGALAVNGEKGGTATVNVYAADGVKLNKGDTITLIDSDMTLGTFTGGDVLDGVGEVSVVNNDLILTLLQDFGGVGGSDTATTKAIAEGIAASLAFVNQGADMVATSGIDGLYVADSENPTIAAFTGSKNRYNTGSHVDIHGWNALVGIALNNKESFSHGVFVEIGNGDIDTYAALNGSGSSDYKGGGYMLRKDMGKGWTIDGAVRAGRVETSWSNNDKGGYEAKQTYYGAHVTFNKMLKEYGEQKLNGYLRYTFTHLGSDSVNLDGTHYGFDSVNSHRTRLGARMVDEGRNGFELYYGAAWEYGFGGDCDANVNGVTTSGPAVDGSNGVFEVGGTWSENKWEINAGLEGYVGAKRGVAGGMNFIYKF